MTKRITSSTTVLELAAKQLRDKGWTQGARARGKHHGVCSPDNPLAASFCALGAIDSIAGVRNSVRDLAFGRLIQAIDAADPGGFFAGSIATWNDAIGRTTAQVIAMFLTAAKTKR